MPWLKLLTATTILHYTLPHEMVIPVWWSYFSTRLPRLELRGVAILPHLPAQSDHEAEECNDMGVELHIGGVVQGLQLGLGTRKDVETWVDWAGASGEM